MSTTRLSCFKCQLNDNLVNFECERCKKKQRIISDLKYLHNEQEPIEEFLSQINNELNINNNKKEEKKTKNDIKNDVSDTESLDDELDDLDPDKSVFTLSRRMTAIRGLIADTNHNYETASNDTLIQTLCLIVVVDAELQPIMEQYKFIQNNDLTTKFMNLAIISSGKVKNLSIHIVKVAECQIFKRHYSGYTQSSALASLISVFIKPDIVINFGTAGGVTKISKSQYNLVKAIDDKKDELDNENNVRDTVEIGDVIFGEACLFLDRLRTKNKNSFDWGLWGGKSMKCKNMIKDLGLCCGIIGSQVSYGVSKLQSEMIRNAKIIACDMECAPIAQILNQTGINYIVLKVISNGIYPGDSSKNESEYYMNREFVSKKATEIVIKVIEYLNDKKINEL
eukprot:530734_1